MFGQTSLLVLAVLIVVIEMRRPVAMKHIFGVLRDEEFAAANQKPLAG